MVAREGRVQGDPTMRTSGHSLPMIGLFIALQGCSYREVQPPPHTVAIQWESPDFGTLMKAMATCRIPDLEDDADCANRRAEVRQAVDAHAFCVSTKLALYSCRAIERTVQRQLEALTESAGLAGVSAAAEPLQLKAYYPISNKWLAAEWRWKDRATLIRSDPVGTATSVIAAALTIGAFLLAFGQLTVVRFRTQSRREQDWLENARAEAVEQVQMAQDQERCWLILLHLQFMNTGIEQFPVAIDSQHPIDDIWTAKNGADLCGHEDVTMIEVHRPSGVKLVVTNVRPLPDCEGWRFHVYFGAIQDAVKCRRPDTLMDKENDADWSEFRSFQEIPWQRADIAMAVARRLLLRAMRGLEILHSRGSAVPRGWQPYPIEIQEYLVAEPVPEADQN